MLRLSLFLFLFTLWTGLAVPQRARKPNIILIMTDDQDKELGSMEYMPKTLRIMKDQGADFVNAFTNAPICCPSRSSFLTGLHVHNHNVWTNTDNCSGTDWINVHEFRTFPNYLQQAGYRTGYFGKYLNNYMGEHVPPGWNTWMGQLKNTAFYNYKVRYNDRIVNYGNDYHEDYFTDLITNNSLTFLQQSKQLNRDIPVAMVLSMPAPHGPEDSAPQYSKMFENVTRHRTPSWNYAPNPDKEYLLSITNQMEPIQVQFSDLLMRKRLMTLQSVDDAVQRVYDTLRDLGELDNTYLIFTSDHGYHLGQFGIAKGKSMPYDFDIKIPMYMRGPGIKPNIEVTNLVGIIDLAPTFLDLAGVTPPEFMDGRSIKPLVNDSYQQTNTVIKKQRWRDTYLIERGRTREKLLDPSVGGNFFGNYWTAMNVSQDDQCEQEEYLYPCKKKQKNYCGSDHLGRIRIKKCKNLKVPCSCEMREEEAVRVKRQTGPSDDGSFVQKCSIVEGKVHCERVEQTVTWVDQRKALDELIEDYRNQLHRLKSLRKDLRQNIKQVDINKYQPEQTTSLSNENHSQSRSPLTIEASVMKQDELDCLCSQESEVGEMQTYANINDVLETLNSDDITDKQRERLIKKLARLETRQEKKRDREPRACAANDRNCLRKARKKKNGSGRKDVLCNVEGVECSVMDNDHWKTEPRWTQGPFCFCNNAQSNTFWCLRTINETHNYLYCEYVDGYLSYYDMTTDPYQLKNVIHQLSYEKLGDFHNLLLRMRKCVGAKQCTYRHRN